MQSNQLPELLAPAGNFEKFKSAVLYGADAVYLGGSVFNLRASTQGLSLLELQQATKIARANNTKIYFCLNSLPMESDFKVLPETIEAANEAGVNGFIIADPGVLRLAKKYAPDVEIHLSTQANNTNSEAIKFWQELGVSRVNLARELSCKDIYAIRRECSDIELEVFVQGAMCLAISGQCLLSAWLNNRPANLGRCTQPCRFEYRALSASAAPIPQVLPLHSDKTVSETSRLFVEEKDRAGGAMWEVEEGERYSAIWAPEDLSLLPYITWFVKNKIDSLKLEGRMKSSAYIAHIVDAYKTMLNSFKTPMTAYERLDLSKKAMRELFLTASRPLSTGFFVPNKRRNLSLEYEEDEITPQPVMARVLEPLNADRSAWAIEVRGTWSDKMDVEMMLPGLKRIKLVPGSYSFENHRGERCDLINNGTRCKLFVENKDMREGIFIRTALG